MHVISLTTRQFWHPASNSLYASLHLNYFNKSLTTIPMSIRSLSLPTVNPLILKVLLSESDHVLLHALLTAETRHIIDAGAFGAMKSPACHIVNAPKTIGFDTVRDVSLGANGYQHTRQCLAFGLTVLPVIMENTATG